MKMKVSKIASLIDFYFKKNKYGFFFVLLNILIFNI